MLEGAFDALIVYADLLGLQFRGGLFQYREQRFAGFDVVFRDSLQYLFHVKTSCLAMMSSMRCTLNPRF
jgi:hypothetical protein